MPPAQPPAPCAVTLPALKRTADPHRDPLQSSSGRPAVALCNQPAQSAPRHSQCRDAALVLMTCARAPHPSRPLLLRRTSGALRESFGNPRSSRACPRPAASPLRACPPPLACVAPHQPRTGPPACGCRRRDTAAARCARRARGVATHRCRAAPTASVARGRPSGRRALFASPSRHGAFSVREGVCARPCRVPAPADAFA